jgi:hypothetical protein
VKVKGVADQDRGQAVRLVLPKCRLPILARRLSRSRALLTWGEIEKAQALPDALVRNKGYTQLILDIIEEVVIQPRLLFNPTVDKINPDFVVEDGRFLLYWALGFVADDGTALDGSEPRGGRAILGNLETRENQNG